MAQEAIEYLNVQPGCWYVDATLGGGGHAQKILALGGKVLGLDQDPNACAYVASLTLKNLSVKQANFRELERVVAEEGLDQVMGVLFDLGMSSYQLEQSGLGFSFQKDEPLDMRMAPTMGVTAADLVNGLTKKELSELFSKYGEEKLARLYSAAIVEARLKKPIMTTAELVTILKSVSRFRFSGSKHPATRVFQALRIAVNDEINALNQGLAATFQVLAVGGRLVVISFHSLEDRVVKNLRQDNRWQELSGVITPTVEESKANRRSSSAKLRAYEKRSN